MVKLSLTLPFQANERLPSYCFRIAAGNGIESAPEFSAHFGFRSTASQGVVMRIWESLPSLLEKNLINCSVARLLQFRKTDEACGGVFNREFIDTQRCRVCPACVLTDIGPQYSFHRAYGRTEWMLKFVHTCPDHGIPLVSFGSLRKNACDFATQVRTIINKLESHVNVARSNAPARLQDYVINRMRGSKTQGGWLDDFPLQAAAHFAELLGAVVRDGSEPDLEGYTSYDWIEVADIGFGIAKNGATAVMAALQAFLASKPTSRRVRASVFFGRLSAELLERFDQPGYSDLAIFFGRRST